MVFIFSLTDRYRKSGESNFCTSKCSYTPHFVRHICRNSLQPTNLIVPVTNEQGKAANQFPESKEYGSFLSFISDY